MTSRRASATRTSGIEQERNRLAALMSELAQSVIVCNIEGRILLYNARAMQLLRKPLDGAAAAGKAHSLVGLGRSIFAIFDRNLIIHALEHPRHACGRAIPRAGGELRHRRAPAGQLVRVQMAPVLGAAAERRGRGGRRGIAGFVLLLDNITRRIETGHRRDLLLQIADAGHARLARQHARRGGDHRRRFPTWTRTRATASSASSARRRGS